MPPESRILESELLYRVQQRISDGRLPVTTPPSVNAGYAAGTEGCAVCDQQITPGQVSYEVTGLPSLTFHTKCYMAWQRECAQRIADAAERAERNMPPHARAAEDDGGNTPGWPHKA
jgi:hypothetical protein